MITLALVPVVLSALLGLLGPRLARAMSGRAATVLITGVALLSALSVGLVLCALGCVALAQWAPLAAAGHWSTTAVAMRNPAPDWVDGTCAAVALGLMVAAAARLTVALHRLSASAMLCRRLGDVHLGGLVVLNDDRPEAYALAGFPGRTVVTRAMLRALSGSERRALLAHEGSHVANYHFLYVNLVQLAATANPLLLPLTASVRLAAERWADDDAARAGADRDLVATALARAGLARGDRLRPRNAMAAVATDLHVRMTSLATPRQTAARTATCAAVMLVVAACCVASSGALGLHLHGLIEWAQRTPRGRA